jgi:putative transposase
MSIKKTFKYRIYPSALQKTLLEKTLEECRWLYNHLLDERKTAYETTKKSPSAYDQIKSIAVLKKTRPSLETVHSQVSQNIPIRIELAFQAFFRRCKAGEKPGYPRFRGQGQYHSITYPQAGSAFKIIDDNRIKLSKIGNVKIKYHRELQGNPKTCVVSKTSTGKWFVSISCDGVPENRLPVNKLEVGIDMGLKTFATLSDNSRIANPRFFRKEEKALAKAQRKKEKLTRGSKERRKAGKAIPKIHERIANKRKDFLHKEANGIVKKYGIICVEDLSVNDMMESGKKKRLSKLIADASWGLFLSLLSFKAGNAGRTFVKVNPAYTTQDCSKCGTRKPLRLDERMYECGVCGLSMDRDLNASKNILTVGLHSLKKSESLSSGSPGL